MYIIVLIITTEDLNVYNCTDYNNWSIHNIKVLYIGKLREKGYGNQGQVLRLKYDTYNLHMPVFIPPSLLVTLSPLGEKWYLAALWASHVYPALVMLSLHI